MEHLQEFHFWHTKFGGEGPKYIKISLETPQRSWNWLRSQHQSVISGIKRRNSDSLGGYFFPHVLKNHTYICSAFQRKTWTWHDIHWEKWKLFRQDHSNIAGISIEKSVFFGWNQTTTCTLLHTAKLLDAFWTHVMGSGALPFERWSLLTLTTTGIAPLGQSL